MVKKPQNLLTQIILIMVAVHIPVIAFSVFSLSYSNRNLENQVIASIKLQQEMSGVVFDTAIEDTYYRSALLMTDSNLIKLSTNDSDNYHKIVSINGLRRALTDLNENNPYIDRIRIYIPAAGFAVNSNWSSEGSLQYLNDSEFDDVFALGNKSDTLIFRSGYYCLYIFPKSNQFQNIIELRLNTVEMERYFKAETVVPESSFVMVDNRTSNAVFSKMDDVSRDMLDSVSGVSQDAAFMNKTRGSNGKVYYLYRQHLEFMNTDYITFMPSSSYFTPLERSITFTTFTLLFLLISTIAMFVGLFRLIHTPLHRLSEGFDYIAGGNFDLEIPVSNTKDFNYIYDRFNHMVREMDLLITENHHKKLLLQQAHLRQLQAQINPHFLYNSFSMLKQMIRRGHQESSEEVADKLGSCFRYITKVNSDSVTLKDEYGHALNYASIQALRFQGRIAVQFDPLPDHYASIRVPKLILQPIIENAYKYGLESPGAGVAISMRIEADERYLCFAIEDNGNELTNQTVISVQQTLADIPSEHQTDESGALVNIAARLYLNYRQKGLLSFALGPQGGARINLKIPLENREKG